MKYYLITGERSGDLHASNLVREIKKRDPGATFRGVGGDEMEKAQVELFLHYNTISYMGLIDVLLHLGRFYYALRNVKKDILRYRPDRIIYVDFAAFNLRVAPFTREHGFRSYYYISPKIWAWNVSRAQKIKAFIDRMFVTLPFEQEFYARFDYHVDYVGNPVKDAIVDFKPSPELLHQLNVEKDKKIVALLPGSRRQEVRKSLPVFMEVVQQFPECNFIVAAVGNLPKDLYAIADHYKNVRVVYNRNYDVLSNADAAVVTSGTATLEAGLLKAPQMVVYKANWLNYMIGSMVVRVDFISLVNLIGGREIVKELLQKKFTRKNVIHELRKLLYDENYRTAMIRGYEEVDNILGDESPSEKAARLMVGDQAAGSNEVQI